WLPLTELLLSMARFGCWIGGLPLSSSDFHRQQIKELTWRTHFSSSYNMSTCLTALIRKSDYQWAEYQDTSVSDFNFFSDILIS
ncbi:MAG: hypothetical protein WC628_08610, partial [Candidatus Omnitrophota bacterium]